MDRPSSWYEKLAHRWSGRQARISGPGEFTGTLSHQIVVPHDAAGRPGYRLQAAGASRTIRSYDGYGSTTDFATRTGLRSHLIGICHGIYDDDIQELDARAEFAVGEAVVDHASLGLRCVVDPLPAPSLLAGERAVTYTLEATEGPSAGMQVTDWIFDHGGWSFTVGMFHYPLDGYEAKALAFSSLASWTWLPVTR